jgi:GAF domain-containing protein
VAANGRPILNGNPSVDSSEMAGLKSALAIPLEGSQDVAGVLALFRVQPDGFSAADLRDLIAIGPLLGHLIETSRAHRQAARQNVIPIASQPVSRSRAVNQNLVTV